MKRFWLGLGILAALLILGFWVQHSSKDLHKPVVDALKKAQSSAVAEDWEQTEKMVEQAEKHWHSAMDIRSAVCDHDYLEEINTGFAALEVWRKAEDPCATAALCAELINRINALEEAQKLSFRNVL